MESLNQSQDGWKEWSNIIATCFHENPASRPHFRDLNFTLRNLYNAQTSASGVDIRDVGKVAAVTEYMKFEQPPPAAENQPQYENMSELLNELKQRQSMTMTRKRSGSFTLPPPAPAPAPLPDDEAEEAPDPQRG